MRLRIASACFHASSDSAVAGSAANRKENAARVSIPVRRRKVGAVRIWPIIKQDGARPGQGCNAEGTSQFLSRSRSKPAPVVECSLQMPVGSLVVDDDILGEDGSHQTMAIPSGCCRVRVYCDSLDAQRSVLKGDDHYLAILWPGGEIER